MAIPEYEPVVMQFRWEYFSAPIYRRDATRTNHYKFNPAHNHYELDMNVLGEEGWELVGVANGTAYFKKVKPLEY